MSSPQPEAFDPISSWRFRGITLAAGEGGGPRIKGGLLDLHDLERFAQRVRAEMPGALIVCHEYGLRAVASDGGGQGPRLDWSDWE